MTIAAPSEEKYPNEAARIPEDTLAEIYEILTMAGASALDIDRLRRTLEQQAQSYSETVERHRNEPPDGERAATYRRFLKTAKGTLAKIEPWRGHVPVPLEPIRKAVAACEEALQRVEEGMRPGRRCEPAIRLAVLNLAPVYERLTGRKAAAPPKGGPFTRFLKLFLGWALPGREWQAFEYGVRDALREWRGETPPPWRQ